MGGTTTFGAPAPVEGVPISFDKSVLSPNIGMPFGCCYLGKLIQRITEENKAYSSVTRAIPSTKVAALSAFYFET